MPAAKRSLDFLRLVLENALSPRRLKRTPEPHPVTSDPDAVEEYDLAWYAKTAVMYVAWFETLVRVLDRSARPARVLDLGCGPGHFSVAIAAHLKPDRVDAVDLSEPMLACAGKNANQSAVSDRIRFRLGDASRLSDEEDTFDLTVTTHLLHQFPAADDLRRQLAEIDRVTKPNGIVFIGDVTRMKTARLTEDMLAFFGSDYERRGLSRHLDDFRSSFFAAWSGNELIAALPRPFRRRWFYLRPALLPGGQILVGLPPGRALFNQPRRSPNKSPLVAEWRPKWREKVGEAWASEMENDISLTLRLFQLCRPKPVREGS